MSSILRFWIKLQNQCNFLSSSSDREKIFKEARELVFQQVDLRVYRGCRTCCLADEIFGVRVGYHPIKDTFFLEGRVFVVGWHENFFDDRRPDELFTATLFVVENGQFLQLDHFQIECNKFFTIHGAVYGDYLWNAYAYGKIWLEDIKKFSSRV